jgi:hypothetical protein
VIEDDIISREEKRSGDIVDGADGKFVRFCG